MTRTEIEALRALCDKATPGVREQMSGKYLYFDLGEAPQVFRPLTEHDEALCMACSPETIRALCDVALAAMEWSGLYADDEDRVLDFPPRMNAQEAHLLTRVLAAVRALRGEP